MERCGIGPELYGRRTTRSRSSEPRIPPFTTVLGRTVALDNLLAAGELLFGNSIPYLPRICDNAGEGDQQSADSDHTLSVKITLTGSILWWCRLEQSLPRAVG